MEKINFVDLKLQYKSIETEITKAIKNVLDSTAFVSGKFVEEFEENFAKAHEAKYCAAVNSGTAALHVALMAHGVGPGDEVIVPTNTFFATAEAVSLTGATPVFVDCNKYCNIDYALIKPAITDATVAIIPVHLYGQPADMKPIMDVANKHGLIVIEDCAQAHLAEYNGKPVSNFGACGCFSFYPGKNLGAYGEGGAVVTNDYALYAKIKALRDHGSSKKYHHDYIGHNYRMSGIQGSILNTKLKLLPEWTICRIANAELYKTFMPDSVSCVPTLDMTLNVYHLFVIECDNRDKLAEYLLKHGVYTGIHYPIPCHKQAAYSEYNDLVIPNSERMADRILSLPMFPELTFEQITCIIDNIETFYK